MFHVTKRTLAHLRNRLQVEIWLRFEPFHPADPGKGEGDATGVRK